MATTSPTTVRCPRCGTPVAAHAASSTGWITCAHCGGPVPLVPARTVPPRYTWEVHPGLYPEQPPLRPPRFRWRRLIVAVLIPVVLMGFALVGMTGYYDYGLVQPATFSVSGTVLGSNGAPLAGAHVVLDEVVNGEAVPTSTSTTTLLNGTFRFARDVPTGYLVFNVTEGTRAPSPWILVVSYVSPAYNAGSSGIVVSFAHSVSGSNQTITLSPYGLTDIAYVSDYVGSAGAIAAIGALIALAGAIAVRRADRPAMGIVGGAGGLGIFAGFLATGTGFAFPLLLLVSAVAAAIGAFAFSVAWIELIQVRERGRPPAQRAG